VRSDVVVRRNNGYAENKSGRREEGGGVLIGAEQGSGQGSILG
jgi:hypothetical protein